jgi:hypothetical protein
VVHLRKADAAEAGAVTTVGDLLVTAADVSGNVLTCPVLARLTRQQNGRVIEARAASGRFAIPDLSDGPSEVYRIQVSAGGYLCVGEVVNVTAQGTAVRLRLPVDPGAVAHVTFPTYAQLLERQRRIVGDVMYEALEPIQRAGFLNLTAKAGSVWLPDGSTVLDHLESLTALRGDRVFAVVTEALIRMIRQSDRFTSVSGALHEPPRGCERIGSWKTRDRYGNLQVTAFRGAHWLADIDIDDANGLAHVFQVIRNAVSGQPTHPYAIRELLVGYQQIDPGYTLHV